MPHTKSPPHILIVDVDDVLLDTATAVIQKLSAIPGTQVHLDMPNPIEFVVSPIHPGWLYHPLMHPIQMAEVYEEVIGGMCIPAIANPKAIELLVDAGVLVQYVSARRWDSVKSTWINLDHHGFPVPNIVSSEFAKQGDMAGIFELGKPQLWCVSSADNKVDFFHNMLEAHQRRYREYEANNVYILEDHPHVIEKIDVRKTIKRNTTWNQNTEAGLEIDFFDVSSAYTILRYMNNNSPKRRVEQ